jgi:DNA-binding MarR family transcriptional regulator
MSFYEYMLLSMLSHAPGKTLRLRDLAALTNGSLSRVSQVATRLEYRGWLKRGPDPTDGRTTLASLTAAGRRRLVKAAPGHVETVRRLVLDPLTNHKSVSCVTSMAESGRPSSPAAGRSSARTGTDLRASGFWCRTRARVRTARHSPFRSGPGESSRQQH